MDGFPLIFSSSWAMGDRPCTTTYSAGSGFPSHRLLQSPDRNKKLQDVLAFTKPVTRWPSFAGNDGDLFLPPLLDALDSQLVQNQKRRRQSAVPTSQISHCVCISFSVSLNLLPEVSAESRSPQSFRPSAKSAWGRQCSCTESDGPQESVPACCSSAQSATM